MKSSQKKSTRSKEETTKLVLMDFDGVIFDSFDTACNIVLKVQKEYGVNAVTDPGKIRHLWDMNFYDAIKHVGIPFWKLPFMMRRMKKLLEREYEPPISKGIIPVIKELAKKYPIVVVSSNFNKTMKKNLDKYHLSRYFKELLGADFIKSKIKKILYVCLEYNIKPEQIVFISDTAGDIYEGKKAGVKTIGVTWGFPDIKHLRKAKPDFIVKKPSELLRLL